MKPNLHKVDRILRFVGGLFIASMAFWGPSNYWFLIALIFPLTATMNWCPIYAMLGFKTNSDEEKKS